MDHGHDHDYSAMLPPVVAYSFAVDAQWRPLGVGAGAAGARGGLGSNPAAATALDETPASALVALSLSLQQASESNWLVSPTDAIDAIVLSFLAFNRSYSLDLVRKHDLFADSIADWLTVDGEPVDSIRLPTIYEGHITGWNHHSSARIIMHTDEHHNTVFEGSFTTPNDGLFNLKAVDSYLRSKRPQDIQLAEPDQRPPRARESTMIVFHDSGLEPPSLRIPSSALLRRSGSHFKSNASPHLLSKPSASCAVQFDNEWNSYALSRRMNDSRFLLHSSASGKFAHFDRLHRRAGAGTTTGQPGCNKGAKQFVFMGTAADCNYVNSYGGTANALKQILSDFNQASAVYESSFNVGLAIIKVDLRSQCQSGMDATSGFNVNWNSVCSDKYSISQRLSDFSQWRGTKDGSTPDNAGLWHLMTGCTTAVSGQAVGIAWLQTLCLQTTNGQSDQGSVTGSDFVSGTAVSSIVTVEWKVVAHEVGHNFGAHHDCTASTCPADSSVCCPCSPTCDCAGQFLMHPTDNAITSQFSPCSVKDICATLQDPNRYGCLKPPNALQALTTNICGNGVKEGNEECDCGGKDCGQTDPCCDGATCKLTAGSVCDDKNDDCCSQCQFRAQGFVCRPSTGICDYAEVCTGKNGTCPPNLFAPNGQTCGNNGTVCASGICTSRDDQCRSSAYSITTSGVCPGTATQCQLLCQGPGGQCYQLAGNMIDGTPCGYAGSCVQGSCQENGWFAQAIDLFMANLQISIPIAIAVGFLILSLIWSMCGCCYRQYKYGSAKKQPRRPRPHDLPVVVPTAGIPLAYTQYGASASAAGAGGYGSYQQHQHPAGGAAASYGTPAYQVRPGSETANARPGQTPVFIPSEERRGGAEMDTSSQSHWVDPARYNGVS